MLGVWVTAAAGCGGGPEPLPFHPVADTQLLMASVVDPHATVIWDAVATVIDEDGEHEVRPRTPEEWAVVRNSAVALAESGNLLMMAPRALDGDEWMEGARALVDTGVLVMRAVEARDADEIFELGGTIYTVCTNCHQKYLPQGAVQP